MRIQETRVEARSGLGFSPLLLFALVCAATIGAVAIMPLEKVVNQEHANTKHSEAVIIRRMHRNGICYESEAWISKRRGTLLVLCRLEDKPKNAAMWGGIIWRVLEYRQGHYRLLGQDTYECTAYMQDWTSWMRVLQRDGYVKAHDTQWFGPLGWLINP